MFTLGLSPNPCLTRESNVTKITAVQFDALVKLMRGIPESPANRAARRVLVDGLTQAQAVRETGATRSTVSDAVGRYEAADTLIRAAYAVN